jgi:pSer/pThr/pTyr-binding forkhead associated (FHA) protein
LATDRHKRSNKGEIFLVEPGQTLVIGRGEHVDVKLKDPAVSRVHLEIANLGNELMMADRGSSSGTFVMDTARCKVLWRPAPSCV